MAHELEVRYGLSSEELLNAIERRFRLRTAVEGAVAEEHMERKINELVGRVIERYEAHDLDGHPDFSIWLPGRVVPLRAECKNIRDSTKKGAEAYRVKGEVVAFKVETQKTRAAKGDPTSRYYEIGHFDILGVCLGKKTGCWSDLVFIKTADLTRHPTFPSKLAVMQRVPLHGILEIAPWYANLAELLRTFQ
jgi:hypothetical protein